MNLESRVREGIREEPASRAGQEAPARRETRATKGKGVWKGEGYQEKKVPGGLQVCSGLDLVRLNTLNNAVQLRYKRDRHIGTR